MADEEVVKVEDKPPDSSPPEPTDESGVHWKNRVAEWQRKAQEAEERAAQQEKLNQAYQIALGQRQAAANPAPVADEQDEMFNDPEYLAVEKDFTPDVQKLIRTGFKRIVPRLAQREARRVGDEIMSQASVQSELQDQEILAEAQKQYAALATNRLWSSAPDVLKQEHAVAAAKNVVLARRKAAGSQSDAEKARREAEEALKATASLPGTGGGAPPRPTNRDEFIKNFVANPEKRALFQKMTGVDPDSEAGKKRLRRAAEIDFETGPAGYWGGKTGVAIGVLKEEGAAR
jgi:hypothetical protein